MSFPKYPAYRTSGVEWLGEVPEHWAVMQFKWQIATNDGGVWGDEPNGEDDTIVLRSTDQTVDGNWKMTEPALRRLGVKEKANALLKEGDLVITKSSGSSSHIGKTTFVTSEVAAKECCFGNFMQRIRTKPTFTPKLAWYILNNEVARFQLDLLSNSTTGLANLNGTLIGEVLLAIPTAKEQAQIARFLDHETANIDTLIEEQQRLIELLKEKRQAVISHAVTKGLDPNVPMKDSGVEWLGKVPEHWKIVCIKHVVESMEQGWSPQCDAFPVESNNEWGVLKVGCVNGGVFTPDENKRLPTELDPIPSLGICRFDLLVSRANTRELVGSAAVAMDDYRNLLLCDKLYRIRVNTRKSSPQLLSFYLAASPVRGRIELSATGASSSMVNIGQSVILDLKFALAPLEEQMRILSYIRKQLKELAIMSAAAQRTKDLLAERRTALISAAVTGKIDARGWQPRTSSIVPQQCHRSFETA